MKALILAVVLSCGSALVAQVNPSSKQSTAAVQDRNPVIALHEVSRESISSEMGGAFMFPSTCDTEGNLFIRKYAAGRSLLSPVVKIDSEGKRVALFDAAVFSHLKLNRVDAFQPAPDGGLYQIGTVGIANPQPYILHFAADGSADSAVRLDGEFHPYQFTPFANGNLLVSGARVEAPSSAGRARTAVFLPDGRLVADLKLKSSEMTLAYAEAGSDGNIYALRGATPLLVYVISPSGQIVRRLKIDAPSTGAMPQAFHLSANRFATSFWDDATHTQSMVITDAQTGRRIATYADSGAPGLSFTCYSANDAIFTFLHLGEGNTLEVVRAEAR